MTNKIILKVSRKRLNANKQMLLQHADNDVRSSTVIISTTNRELHKRHSARFEHSEQCSDYFIHLRLRLKRHKNHLLTCIIKIENVQWQRDVQKGGLKPEALMERGLAKGREEIKRGGG